MKTDKEQSKNRQTNKEQSKKKGASGALWVWHPHLESAKQVFNSGDNWLNKVETDFVRRSARRKFFIENGTLLFLGGVSMLLLVLFFLSLKGQRDTLIEQIRTSRESAEANLKSHQDLDALLSALKAGKLLETPPWYLYLDSTLEAQVRGTLYKVLYSVHEQNRLEVNHGAVYDMALSPNGKYVAIVGEGDKIILQDNQDKQLGQFSTEQKYVYSVAWSRDNTLATGAEDGTIKLWKIEPDGTFKSENNKNVQLITIPSSGNDTTVNQSNDTTVNQITFSYDGKQVATVEEDGKVQLWDVSDRKLELNTSLSGKLEDYREKNLGSDYKFYDVTFSPTGKTLALAGEEDQVILWNISVNNTKPNRISTDQGSISHVAFKTDKELVTGNDNGEIQLWMISEKDSSITLDQPKTLDGGQGSIYQLIFSSDGKRMASLGLNDTVKIWNTQTWNEQKKPEQTQLIQPPPGNVEVTSVAYSPDGKELVTAGADGIVRRWDPATGKQIVRIETDQIPVISVGFFEDKLNEDQSECHPLIGTLGYDNSKDDNQPLTLQRWDVQNASCEEPTKLGDELIGKDRNLSYHAAYNEDKSGEAQASLIVVAPNKVAISPDRRQVAFVGADGNVRLWNAFGSLPMETRFDPEVIGRASVMAFSPNGKLAVLGTNGTILLWDINKDSLVNLTSIEAQQQDIVKMFFDSDSNLLVIGKGDTAKRWQWDSENRQSKPSKSEELSSIPSNLLKDRKLTISSDGKVSWNIPNKDVQTQIETEQQGIRVAFSLDGQRLATADNDGIVKYWSTKGELLGQLRTRQKLGQVQEAVPSEEITPSLKLSPDGQQLATLGSDGILKLWDISNAQLDEPLQVQENVSIMTFSSDGKHLATVGKDGTVKLWQTSFDALMQQGCSWARNYLTNNPSVSDSEELCSSQQESESERLEDRLSLDAKPGLLPYSECEYQPLLALIQEPKKNNYTYPDGRQYYGPLLGDKPSTNDNAQGLIIFPQSGDIYYGSFRDSSQSTCGTYQFSGGTSYTGQFQSTLPLQEKVPNGWGIWTLKNAVYIGESKKGRCEGVGTYIREDGLFVKSDKWKNGRLLEGNLALSCDF